MARIENAAGHGWMVTVSIPGHRLDGTIVSIPSGSGTGESPQFFGVAEVPDDVAEWMSSDAGVGAWFGPGLMSTVKAAAPASVVDDAGSKEQAATDKFRRK